MFRCLCVLGVQGQFEVQGKVGSWPKSVVAKSGFVTRTWRDQHKPVVRGVLLMSFILFQKKVTSPLRNVLLWFCSFQVRILGTVSSLKPFSPEKREISSKYFFHQSARRSEWETRHSARISKRRRRCLHTKTVHRLASEGVSGSFVCVLLGVRGWFGVLVRVEVFRCLGCRWFCNESGLG